MSYVLTCQDAFRAHVRTCQLVLCACILTYQRTLRTYVPCVLTCSRVNVSCALTCLYALRALVLTCSRALRAYLPTRLRVPTCLGAITLNIKNKFIISWHVFLRFLLSFWYFLLCVFLWNKMYLESPRRAGMSLKFFFSELSCRFWHIYYQAETFNGCYDKLCTVKWFDFYLSRTLWVIFKWLINGEK